MTTNVFTNIYQDVSLNRMINHSLANREEWSTENEGQDLDYFDSHHQNNYGLDFLGMKNLGHIYYNLSAPKLIEHSLAKAESVLASNGALCVKTGKYTGRSPNDKFIVEDDLSRDVVHWNNFNVPISEQNFERIYKRVLSYIQRRDLYVFDGFVGADPHYRIGVRVINEFAWQNLFVHQLFLRPTPEELTQHRPDFTVISVPGLEGDPDIDDGINSEAFIIMNLSKKLVIIGGSRYAGEMKKSAFSLMNYLLPLQGVLPMHCAANMDKHGNTALFFGLSGTGKTTLSADPERRLIGDDEHGWSENGIFNFEGGCYAKTIKLSQEKEPQIWSAIRFGSVMENVVIDRVNREVNYDDDSLTENTRVAYPIDFIPDAVLSGTGNHPKSILFLTADAFGVLPPIAKLTKEQAMYYFMSGYTSKVAGTERGITEPQVTFSACFGKCFLPLSATIYAHLLGENLDRYGANVYLVNTGWTGGGYGIGKRMDINLTRALVSAALNGDLDNAKYHADPVFKILVPDHVPGVEAKLLNPRNTWSDPQAYDLKARELAVKFVENFQRFANAPASIIEAGPQV
jgi:phosphoenolpyruvate carboxykinase (ATP)